MIARSRRGSAFARGLPAAQRALRRAAVRCLHLSLRLVCGSPGRPDSDRSPSDHAGGQRRRPFALIRLARDHLPTRIRFGASTSTRMTAWIFQGLTIDSLPRSLWYTPQHAAACGLGLIALIGAQDTRRRLSPKAAAARRRSSRAWRSSSAHSSAASSVSSTASTAIWDGVRHKANGRSPRLPAPRWRSSRHSPGSAGACATRPSKARRGGRVRSVVARRGGAGRDACARRRPDSRAGLGGLLLAGRPLPLAGGDRRPAIGPACSSTS